MILPNKTGLFAFFCKILRTKLIWRKWYCLTTRMNLIDYWSRCNWSLSSSIRIVMDIFLYCDFCKKHLLVNVYVWDSANAWSAHSSYEQCEELNKQIILLECSFIPKNSFHHVEYIGYIKCYSLCFDTKYYIVTNTLKWYHGKPLIFRIS